MIKSKVDYPHPVLSPNGDDYIETCMFKSDFEILSDEKDEMKIKISYELVEPYLEFAIITGKAVACVYAESANSSYRLNHYFQGDCREVEFVIDKSHVSKKVIFRPYIIAKENIDDFRSIEFNYEYFGDASFSVRKGDVLAYERQYEVIIDDVDSLKNAASVFSIRLDEKSKDTVKVDYYDQKINIMMNSKTYDMYRDLRERSDIRIFLSSVLVLPALVEAVEAMKREKFGDSEDGLYEKRWFLALEKQMNKKSIKFTQDTSSVLIANQLIGDIVSCGLIEMDSMIKRMGGVEEQ